MRPILPALVLGVLCAASAAAQPSSASFEFQPLFNGTDLTGWRNINTAPDTWSVRDGMIITTGTPMGVLCTTRQFENYVLSIEWMHMQAGGNSGVFMWSNAVPQESSVYPSGLEVQMLEIEWPQLNVRNGVTPPDAYVHGELFGVGTLKIVPDNPRGPRSKSLENRALGRGNWNHYQIVAVDGVVKLAVNGKYVNGISQATQKKGYLCLESEGAEARFRNIRILELLPGVTSAEQAQPLLPQDRP